MQAVTNEQIYERRGMKHHFRRAFNLSYVMGDNEEIE